MPLRGEVSAVWRFAMNIGLIAHNSKKTLIEDFCIAYKGILSKHDLYATGTTGRRIEDVTSLRVHKFLPGAIGGDKQFTEILPTVGLDWFLAEELLALGELSVKLVIQVIAVCDNNNGRLVEDRLNQMSVEHHRE